MGGLCAQSRSKAQSVERRWRRFFGTMEGFGRRYVPLVVAALSGWHQPPALSGFGHGAVGPLLYMKPDRWFTVGEQCRKSWRVLEHVVQRWRC